MRESQDRDTKNGLMVRIPLTFIIRWGEFHPPTYFIPYRGEVMLAFSGAILGIGRALLLFLQGP
jgi:hypothetical protein